MARIAGIDLPNNKRGEIGLTYIYGIGRSKAQQVLAEAGIDKNIKVQDWNDEQLTAIRNILNEKHKLEGETHNMVEDRLKNVELKKLENNLTKTMKELLEKSTTKIIIAGDFNFDFKNTTFPPTSF